MSDNHVIHSNSSDFQTQVLDADVPVLVDFWAEWCQPCRSIAPHVESVASRFAGRAKVVKVDVDAAGDLASRYNIRGIPALLVFKDGAEVERVVGNPGSEGKVAALLETHLDGS